MRKLAAFGVPILLLVNPAGARTLAAQDRINYWVECFGGLVDAAGVIGPRHDYEFNGECVLWRMVSPDDPDELVEPGGWNHDKKMVTFPVRGRASWQRLTGQAEESLELLGPITGKTFARATCIKDPFLEPTPCSGFTRQTSVAGGPHLDRVITSFAKSRSFEFVGQFQLAEAQALSQQQPPKNPPPPPPMKFPPVVELVGVKYLIIGEKEHVVRVKLRGTKPITARLSKEKSLPRPITLEDPHPGAASRSAVLRIAASAVQVPGMLTITLRNEKGSALFKLPACPADRSVGPAGCPIHVKPGVAPAPTVAAPATPVAPAGRSQRTAPPDSTSPRRALRALQPPTQEAK